MTLLLSAVSSLVLFIQVTLLQVDRTTCSLTKLMANAQLRGELLTGQVV